MAFILKTNPTVINIKLTNEGRKLLSQGKLTFKKWAVGDSEINYGFNKDISFDAFKANILRPKDQNPTLLSFIKRVDGDESSIFTTLPTVVSNTNIITNSATERGFFINASGQTNIITDEAHCKQPDMQIVISGVTGGTTLKITKAPSYLSNVNEPVVGDYILVKWANPLVTGGTVNSRIDKAVPHIWYKIHAIASGTSLSGNNLRVTVDKNLPDFDGQGGGIASGAFLYPNNNLREVSGDSIQTYYSSSYITDFIEDSVIAFLENSITPTIDVPVWNMSIVFTEEVAGVRSTDRNYSQYFSKSYGGFVNYIERISPNIKKIGIIHFSNSSPSNHYGEGLVGNSPRLQLPTVMWHYETGATIGLTLTADTTSKILPDLQTPYHDLVDRFGNVVGKVFNHLKVFVIEDQELLFAMSYKANRNWTLPAPVLGLNLAQCEPVNNMGNLSLIVNRPTSTGLTNGTVEVFVTNAVDPEYSIDGGTLQVSNTFTGVGVGYHVFKVVDNVVPAPNNFITGGTTIYASGATVYSVTL